MSALSRVFRRSVAAGDAVLVPYLTAGDPGLAQTVDYACALVEGGAGVLELGVPFSDPLADGPVIQRASERALAAGTRTGDVLECAAAIHEKTGVPIVLMSYLNPVLRYGWERFPQDAAAAGVRGLILTDLPPEEAGPFLDGQREAGIGTVFLVAPTSGPERIRQAVELTTGFVYCVSRLGVTGERTALSAAFRPVLDGVREISDIPVGVGFGVSTPEQAREVGQLADGVIVGSRLVALAEEAGAKAVAALRSEARALSAALAGCRS